MTRKKISQEKMWLIDLFVHIVVVSGVLYFLMRDWFNTNLNEMVGIILGISTALLVVEIIVDKILKDYK